MGKEATETKKKEKRKRVIIMRGAYISKVSFVFTLKRIRALTIVFTPQALQCGQDMPSIPARSLAFAFSFDQGLPPVFLFLVVAVVLHLGV